MAEDISMFDDDEKDKMPDENTSFGNMNYYLQEKEYEKKHLWKTSEQVLYDVSETVKKLIRGY